MINDEDILLWLDNFDFMTIRKKEKMLELVENPSDFVTLGKFTSLKRQILNIVNEDELKILANSLNETSISKIKQNIEKQGIKYITVFSANYPKALKNMNNASPFVLYYKGDISLIKHMDECFAVVGTRNITNYGKMVTEKFVKDLVLAGFNIVSGLASGVDTVAHTITINNGGKTIAVLAGGLDIIYPATNTNLAKQIVEQGGLLISETRPNKRAESYMFPIRNRIIAGLCRGILLTEAGEKSGALYTKNYGNEYGRTVYAVPGNISSLYSIGTNKSIRDCEAKMVININDIMSDYKIKLELSKPKVDNISIEESIIINLLTQGEKSYQELLINSKMNAKTLNTLLTTLEFREIIKKLAGNIYCLKN